MFSSVIKSVNGSKKASAPAPAKVPACCQDKAAKVDLKGSQSEFK